MQSKKAIALRYEKQRDAAPRIIAKGAGDVAQAILRSAENHDVPVMQNESLVGALLNLELGSVIPEELYRAVAEVLAYVYGYHS
jgi:flagellar biosynthesis protein